MAGRRADGPGPNQWHGGGVGRRQEHSHNPERSVGLSHGCKTDGSIEPMRENQPPFSSLVPVCLLRSKHMQTLEETAKKVKLLLFHHLYES